MGTRSLTIFKNDDKEDCMVMYRQYDGYPTGHGLELAEWLVKVGNDHNGIPCLAAQCVAHFKKGWGNFYLYPSNTRDCGEDYIYIITNPKTVEIYCCSSDRQIFKGTPDELVKKITKVGNEFKTTKAGEPANNGE